LEPEVAEEVGVNSSCKKVVAVGEQMRLVKDFWQEILGMAAL
jgi:hypothetical protein